MAEITVALPELESSSYFTFKEPVAEYIVNKNNINVLTTRMKVVSIICMRDTIRTDLRDPFSDLYAPMGLNELEYKQDIKDNIPVITLAYTDRYGIEKFIRVPHNYIESISNKADIVYTNRMLVMDLGYLPENLDLSPILNDLKDYIIHRTGVSPEIADTCINEVEFVNQDQHDIRETIRSNNITVYKTLSTQLAEKSLAHDSLVVKLNSLL